MTLRFFLALVGGCLYVGKALGQVELTSEVSCDAVTDTQRISDETWDPRRTGSSGLTLNFDATYVFQNVAAGGITGPLFPFFSDEGDTGNTLNGDLRAELDTAQAGWWQGGTWSTRFQGRSGRSVVTRAGSVAAVNNEALFPNVLDKFDDHAYALTELTYTHAVSESLSLYAGLLNTALGDENAIAGSALSHAHFLNFAMLYSLVEDATVPHCSLGAGVEVAPSEDIIGSFSVFGSAETAGENPFRIWNGTTFSTEWTLAHTLGDNPGAQTLGFLYGIDALRADIAADPRLVIFLILIGVPIPTTQADTWAYYYNAHQFLHGDDRGGWGVFARFGISDGNPNFIKQNAALGVGGVGLFPDRDQDRWGLGLYYVNLSDEDLLMGLNIGDEVGGEIFYNIAVRPRFFMTLDTQVMDSALPQVDRTCVLGMRMNFSY